MNEDKLIFMVMETQTRVDRLEQTGFIQADREQLNTIVNTLDSLVIGYKRLSDDLAHVAYNVRSLNDDMVIVKSDISILKTDMEKVKDSLSLLNYRMSKVS